MDLKQRKGESDFQYHRRLIYGKLIDKTLADVDYAELAELVYNQSYSSDVARRMFYGSRKTLELFDSEKSKAYDKDELSEIDSKLADLYVEKQKLSDQRTALNRVIALRARQEETNEIIREAINDSDLPRLDYRPSVTYHTDNDLLVSLNDIHYGADYSNHWGTYNSDICRAMMRKYLDNIISIRNTHNSENCIVWENGDGINGNIRRNIQITNKENIIQQVIGVSELIAEFIVELSQHFSRVKFVSVSGNHSRIDPDKDNSLVDERLDDLVGWYLEARLQNFRNVEIVNDNLDATMYVIDIRGKNYLGVHGDFDPNASQIQSLQTMSGKSIYAVLLGHLHHNKIDEVQGVKTIMAGSFLGMDEYCIKKRIYGHPSQLVCVCDDSGIRCYYDIDLRIQ